MGEALTERILRPEQVSNSAFKNELDKLDDEIRFLFEDDPSEAVTRDAHTDININTNADTNTNAVTNTNADTNTNTDINTNANQESATTNNTSDNPETDKTKKSKKNKP